MRLARLSEIDLAKAMNVTPGPALEAAMRNYNAAAAARSAPLPSVTIFPTPAKWSSHPCHQNRDMQVSKQPFGETI